MGKHQQAYAEFMKQLKKTIKQSRREHGDNEEARGAEVFMKRLKKKVKQSRQENEKAMGSSDTGVYVDMALTHERELNENAHNTGARRARRADVSKRADAEARRARRAKTPMKAYKVGTNFGRKKPKMKPKVNRIIEL